MPEVEDALIAGRYALEQVLGRGGAGVVWRGRDTVLDRVVAIKVFHADLAAAEGIDSTLDRDRVLREARLAARLQHPGAVGIFDVVEHHDRLHLVMELVEAPDLATLVARDGPLAPAAAARIGLQLLDVLDAAHGIGVVHRDVKPSNVMVPDGGPVRLTDFGTAILAGEDRLTATDVVIGSPAYMAPEQATARDVGPSADLWALGATLYHAVEGVPPFSGPSAVATMHSVIHDPPRPAQLAGPLAPLLARLLTVDPDDRAGSDAARPLLEPVARGAAPARTGEPSPTAVLPAAEFAADEEPGAHGFDPALRGGGRRGSGRQIGLVAGVVALLVLAAGLALVRPDPAEETTDLTDGAPSTAVTAPPGGATTPPAPAAPPASPPSPAPDEQGGEEEGRDEEGGDDQGRDDQGRDDQGQGPPEGVPADPPGQEGRDEDDGDEDDDGGPDATAAVPEDWVTYDPDDAPYRLSHPPDWTIERLDATRTDISDPSSGAYLRLDWTDDPAPDPMADWEAYESSFASRHSGYERIRLEPTTFDGAPAALWEYRYTSGGATLHAYNLNVSGEDYGYALNYQTAEPDWEAMEPLFDAFRASYDIVD